MGQSPIKGGLIPLKKLSLTSQNNTFEVQFQLILKQRLRLIFLRTVRTLSVWVQGVERYVACLAYLTQQHILSMVSLNTLIIMFF